MVERGPRPLGNSGLGEMAWLRLTELVRERERGERGGG
jgi:hypothetical protein